MDNSDYTKIYSILGVFQDDGWEMVRGAYKKQIKRWHPDRFQDPSHRKIAEEKSKEINHAYQKLSEYYEKFGVLPPDHSSETGSTFGNHESSDAVPADVHDTARSYAPDTASTPPTAQRSFIPIILTGVLIALGYSIWGPMFESGPNEIDLAMNTGMVDDGITPKLNDHGGQDTNPTLAVNNPDNANGWNEGNATSRLQKTSAVNAPSGYQTAFELESSPAASSNPVSLIKRGSTKSEVLAVQGLPQRQTDSAWDYGASRIYFEAGQVSSWHENPLNPLNVVR